jgi:hypothetical protein
MEKVSAAELDEFTALLRGLRHAAGLTQAELSGRVRSVEARFALTPDNAGAPARGRGLYALGRVVDIQSDISVAWAEVQAMNLDQVTGHAKGKWGFE